MDQYYIEEGYFDGKYFVYTAEAQIAATGYFNDEYIATDYLESKGIVSTLSATGEITVAQEGSASLSSAFTLSAGVGVIKQFQTAMSATASLSALGSRDRDITLVAFTSGALSLTAQRIRDNGSILAASFSIATDGRRFRDISSDEAAAFTQSVSVERSRDFSSTVQAAFSLTLSADGIGTEMSASLTSAFSINAILSGPQRGSASLSVTSQFFTNNFIGTGRPRDLILTGTGAEIQTTIKKFGAGALNGAAITSETLQGNPSPSSACEANVIPGWFDDYVLECWFYFPNQITAYTNIINFGSRFIRFEVNTSEDLRIRRYTGGSTTAFTQYNGTAALATGTWHHLALVSDVDRYSIYVNGSRLLTTAKDPNFENNDNWTGYGDLTSITLGDAAGVIYIDEANFQVGTTLGYDPASTSITVPTAQRSNALDTTVFLYHLNTDTKDDVALTLSGAANLSSAFTVTKATLSGPQKASASLSSNFSLSAQGSRTTDIDLVAFTNGTLSISLDRIRIVDSSQSSAATMSTVGVKITDTSSSQSSAATLSSQGQLIRDVDSSQSAQFTLSALAVRTRDTGSTLSSQATQSTTAVKTVVASANFGALFSPSITVRATKSGDIDLSAQFSQSSAAVRITDTTVPLLTQAASTADLSRIRTDSSSLQSQFTQSTTASGTIDFTVAMSSAATFGITVDLFKEMPCFMQANFTQTTNTFDSLFAIASADLTSAATLSTTAGRIRDNSIDTDAIATQLTAVAKIGNTLVTLESQATQTATAVKTTDTGITLTSQASISCVPSKLHSSADAALNGAFAITADGNTNIVGASQLTSAASITIDAVKTVSAQSLANTAATLNVEALRLRPLASLVFSLGSLSATAGVIRDFTVDLDLFAATVTIGGVQASANLVVTSPFTLSCVGRDIAIERFVYVIPQEIRTWTIDQESRAYTIPEETRIYQIRRY